MSKSHRSSAPSIAAYYDDRMLTEVIRLHSAVDAARLPLEIGDVEPLRARRQEILEQLGDYVIPRLMAREAPLLCVVGGSTGAGKSTLVNTLVGTPVSPAGVLRPTTRSPVLVHHPDDAEWFSADQLLPDLRRVKEEAHDQSTIQLVPAETVPAGLAILDAPDVDSVEQANRHLAGELLGAADLWLFVTSAARYADQVPWDYLRQAAERSTAVAIVLDRTPDDAVDYISTHLARMLASRGLRDSPLFRVAEGELDEQGLLPADHVAEVRQWLEALAADAGAKGAVVEQTLSGAVRTLTRKLHPLADATEEQRAAGEELASLARRRHDATEDALATALRDGTLLTGDLFARWQEFLGSGELIHGLEGKVGFVRERLRNAIRGKPQQAERVEIALTQAVGALVTEYAERASADVVDAWRETSYVALEPGGSLTRASTDLRRRATSTVRGWQDDVQQMVRDHSGDLASSARFLTFGVRGLAAALSVTALARDGAPEPARESTELGRRLLDSVFGQELATQLLDRARDALRARVHTVFDGERGRYESVITEWGLTAEAAEQLRQAVRRVDDLRFSAQHDPLGGPKK
ncbi:dynamin family protein [Nocardioides panacisoli]|uniref:dynamin family protein n=1 Tax=Nocardioides panacisoli TaxID=627624 RepID=UPI001C62D89E|nr:dynamin family protein [Nocardioides panacisoli]QYJ04320.1 dynamin family protein [Nocardioides panacisoli]